MADITKSHIKTPGPNKKSGRLSFLRGKRSKSLSLIIAGVVAFLGASAAAYYGVVAPNQPDNVLKTAVEKQLQKRQSSSKGTIGVDQKNEESGIKNITIAFKGATDADKQAFSAELETAVSGAKLPVEIRSLDNSLFFKIGDLGSVKSLASLAGGPETAAMMDAISSKLGNVWIEVDQSLLKQANAECTANIFSGFDQKDIDDIMKVYSDNSFLRIKNTSDDSVEGNKATKYDLGVDKGRAEQFSQKLGEIEVFKRIQDCANTTTNQNTDKNVSDSVKDADVTMAVWVDEGKNLRKLELKGGDNETALDLSVIFTDDKVDIQKPTGAKPLMEILGGVGGLMGGTAPVATTSDPAASNAAVNDYLAGMSDSCKAAYQSYISSGGNTQLPADCL